MSGFSVDPTKGFCYDPALGQRKDAYSEGAEEVLEERHFTHLPVIGDDESTGTYRTSAARVLPLSH